MVTSLMWIMWVLFIIFPAAVVGVQCLYCNGSQCDATLETMTTVDCPGSCQTQLEYIFDIHKTYQYITYSSGCYYGDKCTDGNTTQPGVTVATQCCHTDRCNMIAFPTGYTKCYSCLSRSNDQCHQDNLQTSSYDVCRGKCLKSQMFESDWSMSLTQRTCISECTEVNQRVLDVTIRTWCCQGDLCNCGCKLNVSALGCILWFLFFRAH